MNSQYLKIGDYILLYSEQSSGFLTTLGFDDQIIFVQKCTPEQIEFVPNLRNMVFRVLPKLVYDAAKEYQKEKVAYDQHLLQAQSLTRSNIQDLMGSKKATEAVSTKVDSVEQPSTGILQLLKIRMDQEEEFNQRMIRIKHGEIVNYGNEIQFQHVDSCTFLQVAKTQATHDRLCTKVQLTNTPSPNRVVFEILPRYKYRQEGDKIVYTDQILIYNSKQHVYLHFSSDFQLQKLQSMDIDSEFRPKSPERRIDPQCVYSRNEVNVSTQNKRWQILPYRKTEELKDIFRNIHGGDIIRLRHAESGGYLCVDEEMKLKNGTRQGYIRVYRGDDDTENMSTNSMFEIILNDVDEIGQQLVYITDNGQPKQMKFRHLNSGRLLQVQTQMSNSKETFVLCLSNHGYLQEDDQQQTFIQEEFFVGTEFTIDTTITEADNEMKKDSVVKIKCCFNDFFISVIRSAALGQQQNMFQEDEKQGSQEGSDDEDYLKNSFEDDEIQENTEKIGNKIFTPMNKEEFNQTVAQKVLLKKVPKEEDTFVINKCEDPEILDLLFIHSCIPIIKQFITYIRKNDHHSLNISYLSSIETLLTGLIFFVVETETKDPFICEGIPNKVRQKYFRETRVIDLFVDMIYYPFSTKLYNINDLTQKHPITKICKLVYRLLKHCVKDYTLNKFYVAQWIDLFFNQAMITSEENNFMAEATITELLTNNKVLLDKQITKETIKNFIDLCKYQKKNERFLNLLAALCSCNGDAVTSNQDDICEILLEEEENKEALIIKMKTKGPQQHDIYIEETAQQSDWNPQWVKIEDLQDFSMRRDDLRIYNYFQSMINLNAEMCLQRNYKGILLLENIFSLEQIIDCTLNNKIPHKLRSKFAKLLLHLHVDKDPLEIITVPVLTRVWHEVQGSKTQLPTTKVAPQKALLLLKPFVRDYFKNIGGIQKAYEIDLNLFTIELLNLIESMIKLGLYNDEEELIQIVDPLISLLDGSLDFCSKDDEQYFESLQKDSNQNTNLQQQALQNVKRKRYETNETNLLIMETKNKIINILHLVLNMQNDIRLTRFLIEFNKDDRNTDIKENMLLNKLQTVKGQTNRKQDDELDSLESNIEGKIIKWTNIAFKDKKLDLEEISARDFVCILLDIILYENPALVNNAFKLLVRFFNQKRAITDLASNVQLLEEEYEIAILKKVSQDITQMKKDAENSEFWLGYSNEEALKKTKLNIQRLDMITDLCIKNPERLLQYAKGNSKPSSQQVERRENSKKDDISFTEIMEDFDNSDQKIITHEEEIDQKNQTLLRNLRAHEVALIIIKQQALSLAENQNVYLKVLEKAYIFLIKFVRQNKDNQLLLMSQIDLFIEDIETGVHAMELISEIFKENDKLQTFNIAPIIKKICTIIDDLSIEVDKKATFLSFLPYYMKYGYQFIKDNQILLLNEMTSSQKKNSIYLFSGEEGNQSLGYYLDEMKQYYLTFSQDNKLVNEIELPIELTYTIQFIKFLSFSAKGFNAVTEIKCKSLFTIQDLSDNFQTSEFCYPLKIALGKFLHNVYLEVEKDPSEDTFFYLWTIIETFVEDINLYLEAKMKKPAKRQKQLKKNIEDIFQQQEEKPTIAVDVGQNFKMKDCFGSSSIIELLEQYIFIWVVPCLTQLFKWRMKMDSNQEELMRKMIQSLQKISMYAEKDLYIDQLTVLLKQLQKWPQLKQLGDDIKNLNMQPRKSMVDRRSNDDFSKKMTKEEKLKAQMFICGENDAITHLYESEFEELVMHIVMIKKKSTLAFEGTNTLITEDIIKSLINMTDINSEIEKNLRTTSLKILRKVIEQENKGHTTPSSDWESEDWLKYKRQIAERQDTLVNLGVIKLICRVITFESVRSIREEATLLAIAALLGGNNNSQMRFLNYIQNDKENLFILKIRDVLNEAFELITITEQKRNQLMTRQQQLSKKLEQLQELGGENEEEIKKVESSLQALEDELRDFESKFDTGDKEELTPKRASETLIKIMRFLQLLCENHNIHLQNALREQTFFGGSPNQKSFDFPSYLAKVFSQYIKVFNLVTCDVGEQMIDTLIELIQGPCRLNQKALIGAKIIDSSRDFIGGYYKESEYTAIGFSEENLEEIDDLKQKLVTLLLSLLEGETDMDIVSRMSMSLDFQVMKERLLVVFNEFVKNMMPKGKKLNLADIPVSTINSRLQKDSFESRITEAFEIYILLQQLSEYTTYAKQNLDRKKFTPDEWKAYEFIRSHTGSIEISVNNNLQRVYFPIRPICHYISKDSRVKLSTTVNRESQATKINGLMNRAPDLIDEMHHNESLTRSYIQITPKRLDQLKTFSSILAIFINLMMIFYYDKVNNFTQDNNPAWLTEVVKYIGITQGASSGLLIFFYVYTRAALFTKSKWRDYIKQNKNKYKPIENEERLTIDQMSIEMTHVILMTKGPDALEFQIDKKTNFGNFYTKFEYYIFNMWFLCFDGTFQYYVLYFMISLLGFLYLDIYYCFHLLDIIAKSPTLQNVIKAVTMNLNQLLMAGMLALIVIFIYSVLGFFYLQDTFIDVTINPYDPVIGENFCQNMLQCFVQVLNLGLRAGGGIGDMTRPLPYDDKQRYFLKIFYDSSFHICVIIILLNIFFGIIIDTFAQLRDKKKAIDEDMQNICFICNLERYTVIISQFIQIALQFDKYSDGFERHIERDHNLWYYVFYIVHLQMKDPTEYTGIESYVFEKFHAGDIVWVPLMKALCLDNKFSEEDEDAEKKELEEQITNCHEKIEEVITRMDKLVAKFKNKDAALKSLKTK